MIKKAPIFIGIMLFLSLNIWAKDTYKIGVLGNTLSSMTQAAFNTVELFAEQHNNTENSYYLSAVLFDEDEDDVKSNIKYNVNLVAVIGCFNFEKHKDIVNGVNDITLISICSQYMSFTDKDNAFRMCASEAKLAAYQARVDIGVFGRRKYGVFYDEGNDDYLKMAESFRDTVKANNCIVDQFRSVNPERDNFKNLILYLRDKKTRVVYYAGAWHNAAQMAKQARKLNAGIILVSSSDIYTKKFVKKASSGAEGSEFTTKTPPSMRKIKKFRPFYNKYTVKYKERHKFIPYVYESLKVVEAALDEEKKNSADMGRFFKENSFNGVFGKIAFDKSGERIDPPFWEYIIRRGSFWLFPIKRDKKLKFDRAKDAVVQE